MKAGYPFDKPWAGHDLLARQLSRGMYQAARELTAMLLGIALVLTALAVVLVPGPATYGVLVVALALPTSLRVGRGTALSIDAMRTLWLAPEAARVRWMQGWRHLALLQGPAWAGAGLVAVAMHEGLSETALFVFGAVLAAQAITAWAAYGLRGHAPREWRFVALLGSLFAGMLCSTSQPLGTAPLVPMAWVAWVLGISGAWLLWRLGRQLQLQSLGRSPRPAASHSARWTLSELLSGWAVTDVGGGQRGAGQVLMATLTSILMVWVNPYWFQQSQWQQPHGPAKLLMLGWVSLMIAGSLVHKPFGWRQWLMPGGVPRHRLGWHILASTLKLQGLGLLLVAAMAALLTWWLGVAPDKIVDAVLGGWPLLLEWSVATALSVVWAGLYSARHRWAWLLLLTVVLPAASGWVGFLWGRTGTWPTMGTVNANYVGLLLVVLAGLVVVANVVWARADLHRLMQDHKPRAVRWWED